MKFLKRYGRRTAAALTALGLLSTISAFTFFSLQLSAEVWAAGEASPLVIPIDNPIAANWLLAAGIPLFPGDGIQYKGVDIAPSLTLPIEDKNSIAYQPAFPVLVGMNGIQKQFFSSADTLGAALYENGYVLSAGDKMTLPLTTTLDQPLSVEIIRAAPLVVEADGKEISVLSAGETVGEAIAETGISLQDLDFAKPDEDAPIPADRRIQIVRVREETTLEEAAVAFTEVRVPDPEISIGEERILQSGQNGARTEKVRIRYENGEEVSRTVESEWVSKEPVSQKVAYGTKPTIESFQGAEGPLDYWLAKEVYITSYHDTGSPTASGIWPYYGTIAVTPEWYSILKGSSIYVPGYGIGTVLDVCPGCVGKPWIDVFIPTADYVGWSRTETVYFLPPVPSGLSGDLP